MKYLFLLLFAIGATTTSYSQDSLFSDQELKQLKIYEDTIQVLSYHVLRDRKDEERYYSCQELIKTFVKALKINNSFYYAFDSVRHVSIQYPDDSTFRLITWQLYVGPNEYKYYGSIQMRSEKLVLFPLSDRSSMMFLPQKETLTAQNWYGALYYNIKQVSTSEGTYYTLFGLDMYKLMSRRKVIDVLHFDKEGKPQFGAPLFVQKDLRDPNIPKEIIKNRVIIEYSAEGAVSCNFSDDYGMIIYDNLIRIPGGMKGQGMLSVSDGSYRGYKFDGNHWLYKSKVFNDFQEEAPREQPILDNRKDGLFGPGKKRKNKKRK